MGSTRKLRRKYLIILLPLSLLLANISAFYPHLVEKYYSRGLYPVIGKVFSTATGSVLFSVGEVIVISLAVSAIWIIVKTVLTLIRKREKRKETAQYFLVNALVLASIIYFGFVVLWGLNYNRLPYADIAGLNVRPASTQELAEVCEYLLERANLLREKVEESESGAMAVNITSVFFRASQGYEQASLSHPELSGASGRPKGVSISKMMAYAGISGVYFPFTGEANVNVLTPSSMLPCTAAHEIAHQRGFAREDEANYIAYFTCTYHPDIDFQYSGTFLALRHAMSTLRRYNFEEYNRLRGQYSQGIERDLEELAAFWEKYEGPFEKVSTQINDLYLKSNRQEEGVYSYNRMVDLLIAEYRRHPIYR